MLLSLDRRITNWHQFVFTITNCRITFVKTSWIRTLNSSDSTVDDFFIVRTCSWLPPPWVTMEAVINRTFSQWKNRPQLSQRSWESVECPYSWCFNKCPVYFWLNFKRKSEQEIAVESMLVNQDALVVLATAFETTVMWLCDCKRATKQVNTFARLPASSKTRLLQQEVFNGVSRQPSNGPGKKLTVNR